MKHWPLLKHWKMQLRFQLNMSVKSAISNIGVKVFQLSSQVALAYFTNRVLAPEGRGLVASLSTWHMLLFTVGYLSVPIAIYNLYAGNKEKRAAFAGNALLAGLALGITTALLAWGAFQMFPVWFENMPESLFMLILIGIPLFMVQQFHLSVLQIMGHLDVYNFSFLFTTIVNILLTGLALVMQAYNVEFAIWILLSTWVITLLYTSGQLLRRLDYKWSFDSVLLKRMLHTGYIAHFASIVTLAAQRLDLIMVNSILGQREAGIYFLAIMLTGTLTIIPSAIQSILYPMLAESEKGNTIAISTRMARMTFLIMLIACAGMALIAWPAVRFVGGIAFMEAVPLIYIMLPGVVLYAVPVVLAGLWNSMGIFKLLNLSSVVLLCIIVAADYFFISWFGLVGAACSAFTVAFAAFMIHLFFLKTAANIQMPLTAVLPGKADFRLLVSTITAVLKRKSI
jgi:O-antigen/teichoic acid export membrane protein